MMQVTDDEGITLADYVRYQNSLFVDMVYRQQDGFDLVDAAVPPERQKLAFEPLRRLVSPEYRFQNKEQVREYFTRLTGLVKNLNDGVTESDDTRRLMAEIEQLGQSVS